MVGGHDDRDGDCHHELQTRPRGLLHVPDELLALLAAVEPSPWVPASSACYLFSFYSEKEIICLKNYCQNSHKNL